VPSEGMSQGKCHLQNAANSAVLTESRRCIRHRTPGRRFSGWWHALKGRLKCARTIF
jgi:hypothetical protein